MIEEVKMERGFTSMIEGTTMVGEFASVIEGATKNTIGRPSSK